MRKTITYWIAVLLIMSIAISGCGNNNSQTAASQEEQGSIQSTGQGAWAIAKNVDEFGDVDEDSDNITLVSVVSGDFSNTATSSGDLSVEVYDMIRGNHLFYFTLNEYNKTPATYSSSSELTLKTKVGDTITSYKLEGVAPNGFLFLGRTNTDGNDIFNTLFDGNDIRCIIYIDNSKYNFTISSSGFREVCAEAQDKLDAITEKNRVKDVASVVNTILNSEDGSAKLLETYDYLASARDDYPLLSDDDIKNEINGDFYYSSLNQYKDNGIILTYRYILNFTGNTKTQKLYWKYGINDEDPEVQNTQSKFEHTDGVVTSDLHPYQIRKMADGYYVGYQSDGSDYTIPCSVFMKGHQESTGFVFDYPLSEE